MDEAGGRGGNLGKELKQKDMKEASELSWSNQTQSEALKIGLFLTNQTSKQIKSNTKQNLQYRFN